MDLRDAAARRDDLAVRPAACAHGPCGEPDAGGTGGTGGTALGPSSSRVAPGAALALLRFRATPEARRIPRLHHGQPALAAERPDEGVACGGFFAAARSSIEGAWIRPRRHGYIPFQRRAGRARAGALREGASARAARARVAPLVGEVA